MTSLSIFRALRTTNPLLSTHSQFACRRFFSARPDHVNPVAARKTRARLLRLSTRLPRFLQRYTIPLISAPLPHISAFLLLHELTAIVPLFTLAGIFHYTQWLPPYLSEGKWISNGVEMFGNYFRKRGWLGDEEYARRHKWWVRGEGGVRIVVEFATAYAITKALLPIRMILSIWATPWFATIAVIPFTNGLKNFVTRGGKKALSSLPSQASRNSSNTNHR